VVSAPETEDAVRRVTEVYKGRRLMVGVDGVDLFKGIGLKFLAMENSCSWSTGSSAAAPCSCR
jgi:trehalose 6-phosphate synthase/phosphatase